MTDQAPTHQHLSAHDAAAHPPAEEDWVPSRRIVLVGVASLVLFFVGSLAAGLALRALRRELNPDGPPALPSEAGKAKIGMVEQRLFENANQGSAWRAQAEQRLRSTGWVDRQKGIVHIPIDRAMDLVEKGQRP
ncbi:MAG TPA: hypothetical protein VF341_07570 [Anaeromyxobacteraceae bacterium]